MKAPQRVETGKFYVSHHETETLFAKGFVWSSHTHTAYGIRIVKYYLYLTRSG